MRGSLDGTAEFDSLALACAATVGVGAAARLVELEQQALQAAAQITGNCRFFKMNLQELVKRQKR